MANSVRRRLSLSKPDFPFDRLRGRERLQPKRQFKRIAAKGTALMKMEGNDDYFAHLTL